MGTNDFKRCATCSFWVDGQCSCQASRYNGRRRVAEAARCEHHPAMAKEKGKRKKLKAEGK